ncbi:MAG TPA: FKBP-type peptidyl-prolyl cis-trans isomerase [Bacteroidales bacterium]|jgi:FKBP-type peptidyl-prolyl cis-trans isomerase|nr:FKBP-type peptidyl-prolyl cis-trans isomerase [Bacteroidales bacterium]HOF45651.1 FKBP-type peptidyl-prolyl cis-trans isomerase [Bacteroidales bacterium]HOS57532.1 FKBP-type peptidyl-prolyl cis-trans isomerase [Bacteroidales bacterium]HPY81135.1 FKBP-type peptidyl-prolyl cis-trans isomerase [Bacteroidales bacterium]HQA86421.1 FKBP-type peptidyl-prolyl cis-trans isomerase [Bacteroidales bacterium]
MKKIKLVALSLLVIGMSFTLKSQEMTEEQKIWYAIGLAEGGNFKNFGFEFSEEHLLQGIKDAYAGTEKMTQEEMQATFMVLQQKMQEKSEKEMIVTKEKGKAFLAENKKKEGVIETASGLQYKVVKMGTGPKPHETDKVKVHYHGTLIDGTVFDSSVERGEPIEFPLNGVIKGWTEGVQLMPVGSKFIFYIPSDLAYGDRDAGPTIKGGSTLIFEVELLEINPAGN